MISTRKTGQFLEPSPLGERLVSLKRQAYYAIEMGHLDEVVSKFGGRWCSTPRRLRQIAQRHHQGGKRLNQNR